MEKLFQLTQALALGTAVLESKYLWEPNLKLPSKDF